jgi:hypothetical protein
MSPCAKPALLDSAPRPNIAAPHEPKAIDMKWKALALCLTFVMACCGAVAADQTATQKELVDLSRQKWSWMAERNITALDKLFDAQAVFVHMGATMTKTQELGVIESGRIQYKQADVQAISATTIGDTAIVVSTIQLFALVGGNEARNPFTVTETYIKQAGEWKLAALAFTRRMTP